MGKYFGDDKSSVYHLCSVLVHRGSSAHSGHYIAYIKDRKSGHWYKFNDETVEKTDGNVLKMCSDENGRCKDEKSSKASKGSSDPYMLVYKSASLDDKSKRKRKPSRMLKR